MTTINFTLDVDTGVIGNGDNWTPYITVHLDEDGDCQIDVGETQFSSAPFETGGILRVSKTFALVRMETNDKRVAALAERLHPILEEALEAHDETKGEAPYEFRVEELISDWNSWADAVEDEEVDEDEDEDAA